jgi:preprotein translocase subunit SecB
MNEKYEFSFQDFHLVDVNFRLNESFDNSSEEIKINQELTLDYKQEDKVVRVWLGIDVTGEGAPFRLSAKGEGIFEFKEALKSKKDLDSIARINCAAMIFPFLREFIADLTRRTGFPPLLLPTINFIRLHRELEEKSAADSSAGKKEN